MKIVLTGYRGTGKSSIAELLAKHLNMELVCMDRAIETKTGRSIPEIVKGFGWESFRNIESEIARGLKDKENCVIDTGGGAILRKKNVACLKKNAILIWLTASPDTIINRIKDDDQRPSLTGEKSFIEEIEVVLKERTPLYQACADHTIITDNKDLDQIFAEIIEIVNSYNQ